MSLSISINSDNLLRKNVHEIRELINVNESQYHYQKLLTHPFIYFFSIIRLLLYFVKFILIFFFTHKISRYDMSIRIGHVCIYFRLSFPSIVYP